MSTVDERFELAKNATDSIASLAEQMNEIGIYGEDEFKAAATLLVSLSRAMTILDPAKAKEYRDDIMAQAQMQPTAPSNGGLYL